MIRIDKTSNNLNNIDIPFIPQSWVIWYNWTCLQVGKLIPIQHATTTGLKADKMSDKILTITKNHAPFFSTSAFSNQLTFSLSRSESESFSDCSSSLELLEQLLNLCLMSLFCESRSLPSSGSAGSSSSTIRTTSSSEVVPGCPLIPFCWFSWFNCATKICHIFFKIKSAVVVGLIESLYILIFYLLLPSSNGLV